MHKKQSKLGISLLFTTMILAGCGDKDSTNEKLSEEVETEEATVTEENNDEVIEAEETTAAEESVESDVEPVEEVETEGPEEEPEEELKETSSIPVDNPATALSESTVKQGIIELVRQQYAGEEDIIEQQIRVNTESFYIMRDMEIANDEEATFLKELIDEYSPDWETIEFEFRMANGTISEWEGFE